ncbi:MAG: acyl-CoA dehydrogenase [Agriterribacter sp.]
MFSQATTLQHDHAALLKAQWALAEAQKQLTPQQLSIIYEQKWFNIFVPSVYGGLAMELPEGIRLQEQLAKLDGSVGWTITLCSGANWFAGFLNNSIVEDFFSNTRVCFAGSGAPHGIAVSVNDGFIVNGRWAYATGAPHATAFTANCIIKQQPNDAGNTVIKSFIFKPEEVTIIYDWNATGMKATASHSFEVKDLFVSKDRCFVIDPLHARINSAIYQFPFLQFAEATLAINICGMATHFMDECKLLFESKIKNKQYDSLKASEMLGTLDRAVSTIATKRSAFYDILISVWVGGKNENTWNERGLKDLSIACIQLAKACIKAVDELYPYCGMTGADESSEINRIWRDIHTASQHELLKFISRH